VDIEFVSSRLKGISTKFLTEDERKYLEKWQYMSTLHLQMMTIIWSSKEAIFKWYGEGKVDFKKHMVLDGVIVTGSDEWIKIPFLFKKDGNIPLK
jgi:phosphopantetheinyl transferase (holo-ACP synthase)